MRITGVTRSHGEVEDWDADFLDEEQPPQPPSPSPSPPAPTLTPAPDAPPRLASKVHLLRRQSMRVSGEQFALLFRLKGAAAAFESPPGPWLAPNPLRHFPAPLAELCAPILALLDAGKLAEAQSELQNVQGKVEGAGAVCAWLAGRAALRGGDPFKAQRLFKSALGDLLPEHEGLHALVVYDLALRQEEERGPAAGIEARLQHVSALGALPAWDASEAESALRSLWRLGEHAQALDADVARQWRKHARLVLSRLPPEAAPDLRPLLRERSEEEKGEEKEGKKDKELRPIEDEDEDASDWDLELELPPSTPTLRKRESKREAMKESKESKEGKEEQEQEEEERPQGSSSGSESDWDKEFAASEEDELPAPRPSLPGRASLQKLLQAPPQADVKRYSLLPDQGFKTVKFPPPSALWTLRTKENHKFMSETQLYSWLCSLQFRQEDLLLSKNQPPSLKELDIGTDMWYEAQLAHWQWQHLAGGLAWEGVTKTVERLEKHLGGRKEAEREAQGLLDLLLFLCSVAQREHLDALQGVLRVVAEGAPSLRALVRLLEGAVHGHWQQHNPLGLFCKSYARAKRQEGATPKELSQDEQSPVGVQVRALTQLQLYLLERSPLTGVRQRPNLELSEESSEDEIIEQLCAHDQDRVHLLAELYPLLKPSALKAQAAFALALAAQEEGLLAQAERQAFEAVYLLATLATVKGLPLLLSELGAEALDLYAALLRTQSKYKAWEAALSVHRVMDRPEPYLELLARVAHVAHAEGDLQRSARCYAEMVQRYEAEGERRRNEIVYLAEILAAQYRDLGDFGSAEAALLAALARCDAQGAADPTWLRLQLLRAECALASFAPERGQQLLEALLREAAHLPPPRLRQVQELLIAGYRRKGLYKEGLKLIDALKRQVEADEKANPSVHSELPKVWRLAAQHFLAAGQYRAGVCAVDRAILGTDTAHWAVLGRLYLLRGKLLAALCRAPPHAHSKYPTSLQPEERVELGGEQLTTTTTYTTFRTPHDLVQEATATLRQAQFYFEATGDDFRLAKTLHALALLWLDVCFTPVALDQAAFQDVSTLPYFAPSFIAANTREADKRKREAAEHRRQKTQEWEQRRQLEKKRLRETKRSTQLPNPLAPQTPPSAPPSFPFILGKRRDASSSSESRPRRRRDAPYSAWDAGASPPYREGDPQVRILLVLGPPHVGRTSLLVHAHQGGPPSTPPAPSHQDELGARLLLEGTPVRLFAPLFSLDVSPAVLRARVAAAGVQGVVLVHDGRDEGSAETLLAWWEGYEGHEDLPTLLLATHADAESKQCAAAQALVAEYVAAHPATPMCVAELSLLRRDQALRDALARLLDLIALRVTEEPVPLHEELLQRFREDQEREEREEEEEDEPLPSPSPPASSPADALSPARLRPPSTPQLLPPPLSSSPEAKEARSEEASTVSPRTRVPQPLQFRLELGALREALESALELAVDTGALLLLLDAQLSMAALLWLEGDTRQAKLFLRLCLQHLRALFALPRGSVLKGGPAHALLRLLRLVERALRHLLLTEGADTPELPALLDLLHALHAERDEALRRPLPAPAPTPAPAPAPRTRGDEERAKAALLWGHLHALRVQAERYAEGHLALDGLQRAALRAVKKMRKVAHVLRLGDADLLQRLSDTPRARLRPPRAPKDATLRPRRAPEPAKPELPPSPREPVSSVPPEAVGLLLVEDLLVLAHPHSGRTRLVRLLPPHALAPALPAALPVHVCLGVHAAQVLAPPELSLETLLASLLEAAPAPAAPATPRKSPLLGLLAPLLGSTPAAPQPAPVQRRVEAPQVAQAVKGLLEGGAGIRLVLEGAPPLPLPWPWCAPVRLQDLAALTPALPLRLLLVPPDERRSARAQPLPTVLRGWLGATLNGEAAPPLALVHALRLLLAPLLPALPPPGPLTLLLSPALQALPWELLFAPRWPVVRAFAWSELHAALHAPPAPRTKDKARLALTLLAPTYALHRSQLEAEFVSRRATLKKAALVRLGVRPPPAEGLRLLPAPHPHACPVAGALSVPLALGLPLARALTLIDVASLPLDAPSALAPPERPPLLVLAWPDLLEGADSLRLLRAHSPPPTLLFLPAAHWKAGLGLLLKVLSAAQKRSRSASNSTPPSPSPSPPPSPSPSPSPPAPLTRKDVLLEALARLHAAQIPAALFYPPL